MRLQGHRIEARILRYSSLLPRFLVAEPGKHRFSPVLFDFQYFNETTITEKRVEDSRHLQGLDEELQEVFGLCIMF